MPYASNEDIELAESLGYTVSRSVMYGHQFSKGMRRVWACYRCHRIVWQTADEILQHYCNHQVFETLEDALNRPVIDGGKSDERNNSEER